MPSPSAAEAALAAWPVQAAPIQPVAAGHINDTYAVGERFILQRLNRFVFRNPETVMRNLDKALAHEGGKRLIAPIRKADGATFTVDREGDYWRLLPHVPSRSLQTLPDALLETAAEAFGGFLATFADFTQPLEPVINGFHDLSHYLGRFDDAASTRATDAERREVDALRHHFRPGEKEQVIHGDCKVNNVLFHPDKDAVVAVIDLDTLMFGHPAWDFGDLARTAFVGAEEANPAMALSLPRFERLCRGFFAAFDGVNEVAPYATAPAYMSFMLAVRFLTDHLEGDVYFKVSRRGDNLLRARSQLALARQFQSAAPQLGQVIEKTLGAARDRRR